MEVYFRILGNEVIALFPEIPADNKGNITSYMHVGQHSAASPELITELPEAKYYQYNALLHELITACGYKGLEVVTSEETRAHRQPTAGEIRFGHGAIHYAEFNLAIWINNKTGNLKGWLKADDGLRYYR
jgi:hypothetical protein